MLAARAAGDHDASTAIQVYLHRLRREVAAAAVSLDRLDAVVFTDTINSTVVTVAGDPSLPSGQLNLAGFVLGLDIGAAAPGPTVSDVRRGRPFRCL